MASQPTALSTVPQCQPEKRVSFMADKMKHRKTILGGAYFTKKVVGPLILEAVLPVQL